MDDEHDEHYAYQTVALLSALSVAAEWHETKRLAGTPSDPTTLLPYEQAHRAARADAELLSDLSYRVRVLALTDSEQEEIAVGVLRRMDRALLLRRMGRIAVRLHQHLLSLYPMIDSSTIERVRTLESERKALALSPSGAFDRALEAYVESIRTVAERVMKKLSSP